MEERSLPVRNEVNRHYWDGAQAEKLVLLKCARCATYVHPPREFCTGCGHEELEPFEVSGGGSVYSWSVMHSGGNPGFDDRLPYAVLIVELDEQDRLLTVGNLVDASPSDLEIGQSVEVCFEKVNDEVTLPQWRLASRSVR